MKPSAEVRWFFKGPFPSGVKDWFCGSELCKEEKSRTDQYLTFPGGIHASVKVRGGAMVEIKTRTRLPEPFSLATGAPVGRWDAWVKWTLADGEVAGKMVARGESTEDWIPVAKKRWLRKFPVDITGQVEETGADTLVDRGCIAEVAEVSIRDSHWWTLAFESFGEGDRAAGLKQVARHFLRMLPDGLALTEHDSMAYPEWLSRNAG